MSDIKSMDSDTLRTVEEIKTVLEGTARRVEKGCIVKIHIEDLFDSVTAEQRKSYDHFYGIADNLSDQCPNSGLRSWTIKWLTIYETLLPDDDSDLSYLMDQLETDVQVVNWPDDARVACNQDFRLAWFFAKNESGDGWEFKNLNGTCEFCGGSSCDRMTFKDTFTEVLDDLHTSPYMQNDQRRHAIYRHYVCTKYGVLGVGVRKKIQVCCSKLARLHFPSFDGYKGYQAA